MDCMWLGLNLKVFPQGRFALRRKILFALTLVASGGCGLGESDIHAPLPPSPGRQEPFVLTRTANEDGPWGQPSGGLVASLSVAKAPPAKGEAVLAQYRVRNISTEQQTVWHCGFWPNHKLIVTDGQGQEVRLTGKGQTARAAFAPEGARRKNVAVNLAPQQVDAGYEPLDLRTYFILPTGAIHIRCLYQEGTYKLWSNELVAEIP